VSPFAAWAVNHCGSADRAVRTVAVFTHTVFDCYARDARICICGPIVCGYPQFLADTDKLRISLFSQETHQEMRYPKVASLYFGTPLAFNAPDGGVLLGRDLRKIFHGGQRMAKV